MTAAKNKGYQARKYSVLFAAGLACVCFEGIAVTKGQTVGPAQELVETSRLVSGEQGRLIVNASRELEQHARGRQDCSHLVHQIYVNAGFEYPYASSFEIYAGNENFERVRSPQPGDVIAWPGHVGIVIEPMEHSFYSLVSTGLEAQDYQGAYWRSRGKPRFYRYRVDQPGILKTADASVLSPQPVSTRRMTESSAAPLESRAPAGTTRPDRAVKTTPDRRAMVYGPPATSPSTASTAALDIPRRIFIAEGNRPPTRSEVAAGVSKLNDAAGKSLRTANPLKLDLPVVIVEQFTVEQLQIKRDHGWAHVQVDSRVSIDGGGARLKPSRGKSRWELRRTESGWEAIAPSDRSYVARDVAVKNLAAQLAHLTESEGVARQETIQREESQLAHILSMVLEKK